MKNALRSMIHRVRRPPLHTFVAVVVLTLGLAAVIAVFTYVNGYSQVVPGVDAERLVQIFGVEEDDPFANLSVPDFLDYAAAGGGAFEGVAAAQSSFAASVRHETTTEVVFGQAVSGGFFAVVGIQMSQGRGLTASDDLAEAPPVAVISHGWWQRQFGGDPAVVGRTVLLNSKPFTIVGVTSPGFHGTTSAFRPDVWIPTEPFKVTYTNWAAMSRDRDVPLARVYGRFRPGVSERQGLAVLQGVAAGLDAAYPGRSAPRRLRLAAATWVDPRSRVDERTTTRLMMVAAGVLLILVCANVANLLLAVATTRRHELAMRAALGASPGRLLCRVVTESMVLAAIAACVALLMANPISARLGSYFARPSVWGADVPRVTTVDLRVVAFAVVAALATGLLVGLLSAFQVPRRNLEEVLRTGSDATVGRPRRILGLRMPGVRELMVSAQAATAMVLLVVAGLVLRTLAATSQLDPGFSYDNLVASYVSTSSAGVDVDDRERWFRELTERLAEEPWVRAATVADSAPLSPHRSAELRLEGQTDTRSLVYTKVIPGFFETLGIEVVSGRSFEATDTRDVGGVAIVNQTLAERYFAGADPVGRRLWWPGDGAAAERSFEIVGEVRDAKPQDFIAEPEPVVYFAQPQHHYSPGNALLVVTNIDPAACVPKLIPWLRGFQDHIAIVNALPYSEVVRGFLYTQRMNAELFSALAFLGLVLAAVGVFGVISLAVRRRSREIGVRMSVGARSADIVRLVLVKALAPVAAGLGVGLLASLATTRLVRGLLHGIEPTDPISFATGAAVLLLAAVLASLFPARRAVRTDPVESLRAE